VFSRALHDGELFNKELLPVMQEPRNTFHTGIVYGAGMMELRFGEFFFLLQGLPRLRGHLGVTGTHLFYDPVHDAHIAMNFHSTAEMPKSFRPLIIVEQLLAKQAKRRK
ncbi:MAG: hypothetical protein WBA28_09955, partial [Microbacteriaceae bacterium]